MKISFNEKVAITFGFIAIAISFIALTGSSNRALAFALGPDHFPVELTASAPGVSSPKSQVGGQPTVAPFIVKDTDNDSPGTNIVTRIVTFTAEIDGTPPPKLQWKVDRGAGFVDVTGATRPTLRIGNAQVSDSGFYSLFGTNSAGEVHTTPQQIVITEGED